MTAGFASAALAGLNTYVAGNRRTATSALGGTEGRWMWKGREIFYTEAGSGPTVLLVHGVYAACSSYEFRRIFPLLAATHRVVAIDLLGCGFSEKPNIRYTAKLFVQQIRDAVAHFGPRVEAVVGSSLGAAFTLRAAVDFGDAVGKVVAICPTGLGGNLDSPASALGSGLTALLRTPLYGQALFNLLTSRPSLAYFLGAQAYSNPASATPEVLDHYWNMARLRGSRYVAAHFVGGALNCDLAGVRGQVQAPLLVLWGKNTKRTSPYALAEKYFELASDTTFASFDHSNLLPHEEEPQGVAHAIESFLRENSGE